MKIYGFLLIKIKKRWEFEALKSKLKADRMKD